MSPAVYGSELAETPTLYMKSPMEETFFPPISRKSRLAINDDASEYSRHTRNSMPNSLASSPIKFPTIDRSKSTSVASITGATGSLSRQRSLSKNRDRRNFCRSPSCPSHLEMHRDFRKEISEMEFSMFKRGESQGTGEHTRDCSPQHGNGNDDSTRLPDIFSKDFNNKKTEKLHKTTSHKEILPVKSDRSHERSSNLGLRRADSYQQVYQTHSEFGPAGNRDIIDQRTTAAALLLPIRDTPKLDAPDKKKKKHRSRHRQAHEGNHEHTHRSLDASPSRHLNNNNVDALEAIAKENIISDEGGQPSPRAFEINTNKTVEQWLQRGTPHKHGQVKA